MKNKKPTSEIIERALFELGQMRDEVHQVLFTPTMTIIVEIAKDTINLDEKLSKELEEFLLEVHEVTKGKPIGFLIVAADALTCDYYSQMPREIKQMLGVRNPRGLDYNIIERANKEYDEERDGK